MKTRHSIASRFTVRASGCRLFNDETPIVISVWRNPAYSSASFSRIMIGGLGGDVSTRRNFEDEFIFQLRAAGADGVASYRSPPRRQRCR